MEMIFISNFLFYSKCITIYQGKNGVIKKKRYSSRNLIEKL